MNTRTLKFVLSIFFAVMAFVMLYYAHVCTNPIDQSAAIMAMFFCFALFGGLNYISLMMYPGAIAGAVFFTVFICQSSGIAHPLNELWQWISQNIS